MQTTFEVSQHWGNGLVGFVHVENNGAVALDEWTFILTPNFELDTVWGGNIVARDGDTYTITAETWNSQLAPGEVTKFGFVGRNLTADIPEVTLAPGTVAKPDRMGISTPSQAAIESVDFEIANQWTKRFDATLSFTYTGTQPLDGWTIQLDSPFYIEAVSHGRLAPSEGNRYLISNSPWNRILLPGDTVTISVKGSGSPGDGPTNYYFNGDAVGPEVATPGASTVILDIPEATPVAPVSQDGSDTNSQLGDASPAATVPEDVVPEATDSGIQLGHQSSDPSEPVAVGRDDSEVSDPKTPASGIPSGFENGGGESSESPVTPSPEVSVSEPLPVEETIVEPVGSKSPVESRPKKSSFVYGEALQKSFLFYEAQRSGYLPEDNRIAWRGDSALADGADVGLDLTGGYYDAGDHIKFGLPMASAMTLLSWGVVEYEDAYDASGQFDEALGAIRWGTDYFLKAHVSDGQATQAFYGQVGNTSLDHAYWGSPERLTTERPAYKIDALNPGSDLAAETAAALAAASMIFRDTDAAYADELLTNARQLYVFADTYRGLYSDSIPDAQNAYGSWGYTDELAWGATWLYQATGEQSYLDQAQVHYHGLGLDWTQNWDNKSYGTGVLLAQITGEQSYRDDVEGWLDHWVNGGIETTEGGLAWLDQWGSLRYSANTAFLAGIYSDTVNAGQGEYDTFARSQVDYILGDNPLEQSYVAGIGNNFPQSIHHRAASGTTDINVPTVNENILYGALVGGPSSPVDRAYSDVRTNFVGNEVALDYNAGFTGAVVRLYDKFGGELLSDAELMALPEAA